MNLLRRFETKETGYRYPERQKMVCDFRANEIPDNFPIADRVEWMLRLEIGITFNANRAQYEIAREMAARSLVRTLYAPALMRIDAAMKAAYDDDFSKVIYELSDLRKELVE